MFYGFAFLVFRFVRRGVDRGRGRVRKEGEKRLKFNPPPKSTLISAYRLTNRKSGKI
jgi:hypothetical protein